MKVLINGLSLREGIKTLARYMRENNDDDYNLTFENEIALAELQEIQSIYNNRVADAVGHNLSFYIKMIGVFNRAFDKTQNQFYETSARNCSTMVRLLNEIVAEFAVTSPIAAEYAEYKGDKSVGLVVSSTGFCLHPGPGD